MEGSPIPSPASICQRRTKVHLDEDILDAFHVSEVVALYPVADGLRGLAPILVLATHYGYSEVGWIGLEFFFVLSGFLIASILLTETNRRWGSI